ncbi:hypothetical protein HYH03_017252 [Edaphochlamys debaryana]|uniref:Uncharacterized protein n=1 Tax=Edaphochlamys debaryana TaxID=47281 RepID=A0A835XHK9_9CHLO|nr:hypothetical protein HYH03_017252 [Edaphochlamys debaryana]|eukprot:KAG2483931.1 hypothetical protein HYH03_017252 [Edaphochlamys debaryana]
MPPRQAAAARKTALEQANEQRRQAAIKKLRAAAAPWLRRWTADPRSACRCHPWPLPGAAGTAGPSGSASPSPAAVVPLTDREGRRLRPGDARPARTEVAREALALWGARDFERQALLHTAQYAAAAMAALDDLADADLELKEMCRESASNSVETCQELLAASDLGAASNSCAGAFEMGMRVVGAPARSLGRGGDLDALSPQDLEALYALHEPAQWRQGAQAQAGQAQAGQAQGQGGAGGLRPWLWT